MKKLIYSMVLFAAIVVPLVAQDALTIDPEGRIVVYVHGESLLLEAVLPPVGTINAYGGAADPPAGRWLICDGRSLSSVDYPQLFAVIGTSFGNGTTDGDGNPATGDFNLPDMRGRFARGVDAGTGIDPDVADRKTIQGTPQTGVGGIQEDALEHHNHRIGYRTVLGITGSLGYSFSAPHWSGYQGSIDDQIIEDAVFNGKGSSETRPKNVAVHYIIKY